MKFFLKLLVLSSLSYNIVAQSAKVSLGQSPYRLGTNTENMETPYFKIGKFGWLNVIVDEKHGEWYYPTSADYHEPGYFMPDPQNGTRADFNGDGLEDILLTWFVSPHTIERESRLTFTILLNDGTGGLRYAPEMFDATKPLQRFFAYRTAVADFNLDGKPDIVAASMGMIKRNPDNTYTNVWEPIPLVLSGLDGKLHDASANIQGQENGGLPQGFSFSHELSAGDVNGDGAPDIFTGKCLFLNDGKGKFSNASSQLPQEMKPTDTYLMHSMIGDLNNDGIGDIIAAYADGAAGNRSGYILLSNGNSSFNNRKLVALPAGRYGPGVTKFNNGTIVDVNKDGLLDIVFSITRANPYYVGRSIQIIINKGNGEFVDETNARLVEPNYLDYASGEGSLHAVDVNGDGNIDLVHSGNAPTNDTEPHGLTVYLNYKGVFHVMENTAFAWVQPWQLETFGESFRSFQTRKMARAYPINLDSKAGIDFVTFVIPPLREWPQVVPSELTFYSIISITPLTSVKNEITVLPSVLTLSNAYPNPFNPSTIIHFAVEHKGRAVVRVFDIMGSRVKTLFDGIADAGMSNKITFDASGLTSGMYFIRLESSGYSRTQKVILLK